MSHIEPSTLARYNSLVDPHLQSYFSNERIQSHLKHAGLISGRGEVVSDGEYRTRLARREHRKHVRHMLAENIVNRAIDMERSRNAEMKRHFDMVSKAALVNDIKESRKHGGNLSGLMTSSSDMALLSLDSSWGQTRPRSANSPTDMYDEPSRNSRIQSATMNDDYRTKSSSKTRTRRHRSLQRPRSTQRPRSPMKYPDGSSAPCEITMVYYGPHTKVDYDRMVFTDIDEIMVMQQHCGGENLIVYKNYLKPGAEFTFKSRRHSDYPFGLSLYVKGFIDSRISTCCEYKHRHGVRLGGDRGHFAIKSVDGSKPCIKCRFEKQARLKKYAQSPKDKDDSNEKPITVSMSVSDGPKPKQIPVQISVKRTAASNDAYPDDFDGSEKSRAKDKDGYSTDASDRPSKPHQGKLKSIDSTPKFPPRASRSARKTSPNRSDSTLDDTSKENSTKKTWQTIFHTSNISTGNFPIGKNRSSKRFLLKFSFISNDEENETEPCEIDMKPFIENSQIAKQYSFPTKFKNIGKPEQIHLIIITTQDDEEEEEEVKWHLDHIEVIDPETQSHYIFSCKQWIRPFQHKYLQLSQERSRDERKQRTSPSRDDSSPISHNKHHRQSPKLDQRAKKPSHSSTPTNSPKPSQTQVKPSRRISSDDQSDDGNHHPFPKEKQKTKTPSRSSTPTHSPKPSQTQVKLTRRMSSDDESDDQHSPKIQLKIKISSHSPTHSPKPSQTQVKPSRQISSDDQSDDQHSPKIQPKANTSSHSPTHSPKPSQTQMKPSRQISSDDQSDDGNHHQSLPVDQKRQTSSLSKESQPKVDATRPMSQDQQGNPMRYRVTIYPSHDDDGDFNPARNSRIFLRLNNHTEEMNLKRKNDQKCPTFESGVPQTFELDLIQNTNEQVTKITIGYINSEIQARKWKLEKVVLFNIETGKETVIPCKESLHRNESNFRAEKTFAIPTEDSDDQSTPRNGVSKTPKSDHNEEIKSAKNQQTNGNNLQSSPSFRSMNDDDADYRSIFKQLDPENQLELGSHPPTPPPPAPRPKTRRGRQDPLEQDPTHQPVDPLVGLDDLADHTARSNDQPTQKSSQSTANENTNQPFKKWYSTNEDEEEYL